MIPKFKEGDYFDGIDQGVDELIRLVDSPEYRSEFAENLAEEGEMPLWAKLLIVFFMVGFLSVFLFVGGKMFRVIV